jgi:lysozyme
MTISPNCTDLIEEFEGCKLTAYQDQNGIWTVGYGHTGWNVTRGTTITQAVAAAFLIEDTENTVNYLNKVIKVSVTQNQFDALVSLTFNIGIGHFSASTCLQYLNKSQFTKAADAILLWNHTGGVVDPGLVRRREAERALFLKG